MPVPRAWRVWCGAGLGLCLATVLAAQTPPDVFVVGAAAPKPAEAVAPKPAAPAVKRLPDPSPAEIQKVITAFTTSERLFRQLLANNYTYTESILVQALDGDGNPTGDFQQTNDIVYLPDGSRQIQCTFCPQPTIQQAGITITQEDLTDMFNMNMYTFSVDELPQYNVTYVDHEPLDQITAYVFDVAPKQIVKGHRYFQGRVWVDDQSQMIVKSQGRVVPNEYDKHGNPTNTFLPFQVWRQRVDGKYWFPVYTLMQGTVPGADGAPGIPLRMVIQFKNYKQFRATSRIIAVEALPNDKKPDTSKDKTKKPGGGGGGGAPPTVIPH